MLVCAAAYCAADEPVTKPSVILISIDTLRADHLSAYGYTKIHTPQIDSYAQGGTLFLQAEAQVPLTLPSHTSLFTSIYPFENGTEENGERVPAGVTTLASVLRSSGYKTAAFIGSEFLDRRYGLNQGFDEYDSPFGIAPLGITNPLAKSLRRDGVLVLRSAHQWLDAHRGQPVFAFVHLFDLHTPYTLPPDVARRKGVSRYDAQLQYVDQLMGRLRQDLQRNGLWQKSLIVVFGDHGEGLGEHQEIDHGYYVYESTLHVPLIVHWPTSGAIRNSEIETRNSKFETRNLTEDKMSSNCSPRMESTGRISDFEYRMSVATPVGLIDVAPTILDYLRVAAPVSFEGRSLLGAATSAEAVARPVYSESLYAYDAFHWAPLRALRLGRYKYIQAPRAELYDLDADPRETSNLAHRNSGVAAELEGEEQKVLARYRPVQKATPSALSPDTLTQLESLGYVAAAARRTPLPVTRAALPDPKDRFREFEQYQNAFVALTEGHAAQALPTFRSIVTQDPQNTLARFHLGECYRQLNQPQQALREWETTLKLDPQYSPAAEAIGEYWMTQRDFAKARRRFQQVLALSPESFTGHWQLAIADERLGLITEARANLNAACKLAPQDDNCARELKKTVANDK